MKERTIHIISAFIIISIFCTALYFGFVSAETYTLPEIETDTIPLEDMEIPGEEFEFSKNKSTVSVIEETEETTEAEEIETDFTTMQVIATAYCSCRKCCGVWAENRENGIVYTANGSIAKAGHTIAVDTSVIPFGTIVLIDGIEYVAEDTGSAIIGNRIDIYFEDHNEALEFGIQELTALVKR